MNIPHKAKKAVKDGLARLGTLQKDEAVHFCMVRLDGKDDVPRVVFGAKASEATPQTFARTWKGDDLEASDKTKWFVVRGAFVSDGEGLTTYPARRKNRVMNPAELKKQLKELNKALAAEGFVARPLKKALDGAFEGAIDTAKLGGEDEVVVDRDDEAEDEPEELALEAGDETKSPDVKVLLKAFAEVPMRALLKLRGDVDDEEERDEALEELVEARGELLGIQDRALDLGRRLRGGVLGSKRWADSLATLDELVARVRVALGQLDDELGQLRDPLPALGVADGWLRDFGDSDQIDPVAKRSMTEARDKLAELDALLRTVGEDQQVEALGRALVGDPATRKRAEATLKRLRTLATQVKGKGGWARTELSTSTRSNWKVRGEARAGLTTLRDDLEAAAERATEIAGRITAAGIAAGGTDDKARRSAARQRFTEELDKQPNVLIELAKRPDGLERLDRLVADLGGSVKGDADRRFLKAALEARFQCRLEGDHTTKSLPGLYALLQSLPPGHARDNDKLATIRRTKIARADEEKVVDGRKRVNATGDYKDGVLNVNVGRTGFGAQKSPWKLGQGKKAEVKDAFRHVTLHEIGHSVDDERKWMDSHGSDGAYGAWETHTVDEVAEAIGTARGFFARALDPVDVPRAVRLAILVEVLNDGDPGGRLDAWIGTQPEGTVALTWAALRGDDAVKACEAVRLNGQKGLWGRGNGGADTWKVGDRVYQQAYATQWVSYALGARARKVSDYQFRAPGEWFAEVYAAYYLGTLDPSGAEHRWMKTTIDR